MKTIVRRTADKTTVSYIKVNRMGKPAEKIRLQPLHRASFMDRVERIFQQLTYATLIIAGAWVIVGVSSEIIGTALAEKPYVEVPYEVKRFPPILQRICKAESGGRHFLKSGKVVSHKNTDGTTDWGICQINSRHLDAAIKLGYDIMTEKGNKAFALHMFNTQGSVPWRSSAYGKNGWINN